MGKPRKSLYFINMCEKKKIENKSCFVTVYILDYHCCYHFHDMGKRRQFE